MTQETQNQIPFHPAANVFPLMGDEELRTLAEDIKANGLREPIWLAPDGSILDGRNRYRACQLAGVKPDIREWSEEDHGPLLQFVISRNLHRRHLSTTQRAMAAARALPHYKEQARERQLTGLKQNKKTVPASLPEREAGDARDQVGKIFRVSGKLVDSAAKLQAKGSTALIEAAESDEVAVSAAAIVAERFPHDKQDKIVSGGKKAVADAAKGPGPKPRTAEEKINAYGSKALIAAVENGDVPAAEAETIVQCYPREEQDRIVQGGKETITEATQKAREKIMQKAAAKSEPKPKPRPMGWRAQMRAENPENRVSDEFRAAHKAYSKKLADERINGWKDSDRDAVRSLVQNLLAIVEV